MFDITPVSLLSAVKLGQWLPQAPPTIPQFGGQQFQSPTGGLYSADLKPSTPTAQPLGGYVGQTQPWAPAAAPSQPILDPHGPVSQMPAYPGPQPPAAATPGEQAPVSLKPTYEGSGDQESGAGYTGPPTRFEKGVDWMTSEKDWLPDVPLGPLGTWKVTPADALMVGLPAARAATAGVGMAGRAMGLGGARGVAEAAPAALRTGGAITGTGARATPALAGEAAAGGAKMLPTLPASVANASLPGMAATVTSAVPAAAKAELAKTWLGRRVAGNLPWLAQGGSLMTGLTSIGHAAKAPLRLLSPAAGGSRLGGAAGETVKALTTGLAPAAAAGVADVVRHPQGRTSSEVQAEHAANPHAAFLSPFGTPGANVGMTMLNKLTMPYQTMANSVGLGDGPGLGNYLRTTGGNLSDLASAAANNPRGALAATGDATRDLGNETMAFGNPNDSTNPAARYEQLANEYRGLYRQLGEGRTWDELTPEAQRIRDEVGKLDFQPRYGRGRETLLSEDATRQNVGDWYEQNRDQPFADTARDQAMSNVGNRGLGQQPYDPNDLGSIQMPFPTARNLAMQGPARGEPGPGGVAPFAAQDLKDRFEKLRSSQAPGVGQQLGGIRQDLTTGFENRIAQPDPQLPRDTQVDPRMAAAFITGLGSGAPVMGGFNPAQAAGMMTQPQGAGADEAPLADHLRFGGQVEDLPYWQRAGAKTMLAGGGQPPTAGGPALPGAPPESVVPRNSDMTAEQATQGRKLIEEGIAASGSVIGAMRAAETAPPPSGFEGYWGSLPSTSKVLAIAGVSMVGISLLRGMFGHDKDDDDEEDESFLSKALPFLGLGAAAWGMGGGTFDSLPKLDTYKQLGNAVVDKFNSFTS